MIFERFFFQLLSVLNPFHSSAVVALAPRSGKSTLCALLCIACRTRRSLEEVYRDYAARLPHDFHFTAKQIISFLGFPDEDDDFVDLDQVFADPPRHLAQDVLMWMEGFNKGIVDDVLYRDLLVRYYDSLERKPRVVFTNVVAGVTLPLLCCKLPLDELRIRWRKRTSQDDVETQRQKLDLWERVWNEFPRTQIENEALIRFLSVQFCRFKDLLAGYIEVESGLDPDLNERTLESLRDLLLSPRYTEELSGISRSEVSRCQSDGSGNEVEFSVDRIVTQAAVDILPQRIYDKVFKAAKIQASKKTRVLALLKHAHSICAVYRPTLSDLDAFVQGWSACEWPALKREQLLTDLTLAVDWYRSGDPTFLSALGIELTKHGGFSAERGVSKRQSSVYFVALLRNAADGDQYAVEALKTFCVGTRSKEVLLEGVVPIFSAQQQTALAGSSLAACRIFTYGSLPTCSCRRQGVNPLSHGGAEDLSQRNCFNF